MNLICLSLYRSEGFGTTEQQAVILSSAHSANHVLTPPLQSMDTKTLARVLEALRETLSVRTLLHTFSNGGTGRWLLNLRQLSPTSLRMAPVASSLRTYANQTLRERMETDGRAESSITSLLVDVATHAKDDPGSDFPEGCSRGGCIVVTVVALSSPVVLRRRWVRPKCNDSSLLC